MKTAQDYKRSINRYSREMFLPAKSGESNIEGLMKTKIEKIRKEEGLL
jgi:hypothetical protein